MKVSFGKKLVCAIGALMLIAGTAQAGFQTAGPVFGNSFSLSIGADSNDGVFNVNLVAVRAIGDVFELGSFTATRAGLPYFGGGAMESSWSLIFDTPTVAAASGPGLALIGNNLMWGNAYWSDPTRTVVWDTAWFNVGDQSASVSARFQWDPSGGFTFLGVNTWNANRDDFGPQGVPLPSTAGLAAFGLCGLIGLGLMKRRLVA